MIGFDHFVLYDNKSGDSAASLLRETPYRDSVTIIDWPEEPGQLAAYQHYVDYFRNSFEWTAFIDLDEFVHILDGRTVRDLLRDYAGHSAVLIQWLMFGWSGWTSRPLGLVIENYTMRAPDDSPGNLHVKSIVRNEALIQAGPTPHVLRVLGSVCDARGEKCPNESIQRQACHERAVINHYFTKSRQEWAAKLRKGKATSIKRDEQYPVEMFEHVAASARVSDERLKTTGWALRHALSPSLPFGWPAAAGAGLPGSVAAPFPTPTKAVRAQATHPITGAVTADNSPVNSYPDLPNPDLLALIPPDAHTILDVGCGTGALGAAYREQNHAARLLGIERDPRAAAIASKRLDLVVVADVEAEPFPFEVPERVRLHRLWRRAADAALSVDGGQTAG